MATETKVKFKLTDRQKKILPVLMVGAFFEGFDWLIISQCMPSISRDMGLSGDKAYGTILSIVTFGTMFAYFMVSLGDKIGRRPVFLWSVVLYSVCSLLTAFSFNIYFFVICQFLARVFLVAEWATGFIVISEEFPAETRGRGLTLFQAVAGIGAIFSGIFLMIFKALGKLDIMTPWITDNVLSWRGLYVIGALPLLLILYLKKNYTETVQFQNIKADSAKQGVFEIFKPEYRKYMILVSLLWFFAYLCYATAVMYFPTHVQTVHGWHQAQSGMATSVAFMIGMIGFPVAGILLDSIGRKKTSIIFFIGGAAGTVFAFQAPEYYSTFAALVIGTFFVSVFTVFCASFTNELFPTRVRASANAWGNNIFGRTAQIIAPYLVGYLALPMGNSGNSAALMALGAVVAAGIVLLLPETKDFHIEDEAEAIKPSGS